MNQIIVPVVAAACGIAAGIFIQSELLTPRPTGRFIPGTQVDAHRMSVKFRTSAGYCPDSYCANKEGLFELTENGINDMQAAMLDIKSRTSTAPKSYRFIFGEDTITRKTKLIMVPLDASNMESFGEGLIRLLDEGLPCPRFCDIQRSKVIMGTAAGESCCK